MKFSVRGGYAFANPHDIFALDEGVVARSGQLTGAWSFAFEDGGPSGNAHLDAATLFRKTPRATELSGLMRFHMHEVDGGPEGSAWLYLSYEGSDLRFEGSKAIFAVEGQFVGGTGKYQGATGWLQVKSVNGFDEGRGELFLEQQAQTRSEEAFEPEKVRRWVKAYFKGTRSGDASIWAQAFAANAVLDDPVGSPLKTSPSEILEQGEAFVRAFQKIGLHEDFVHVVGNEAVAKWEGRGTTERGEEVRFEGINAFVFNA